MPPGGRPKGHPSLKGYATVRCCDEVPRKNRRGARRRDFVTQKVKVLVGWRFAWFDWRLGRFGLRLGRFRR
jgi:hypothetical protein